MMKSCFITLFFAACPLFVSADVIPTINPVAVVNSSDNTEEVTSFSGSAPLSVTFNANAENTDGWNSYYEWRFVFEEDNEPYMIRYEENTTYSFTKAGTHYITLFATFTQNNDTISYKQEFWDEVGAITISISESKLEMPNAFSPNGDGINDIYKAKEGYQSLTEFHAYIFNRWGQKLFEWTNPADGWDGTYNGKPVKQGVYFVLVEAKGADGRKYNIRRDVNLLRGYTEGGVNTIGE